MRKEDGETVASSRSDGLFIAFDAKVCVSKHEVRELSGPDLEEACQKWVLAQAAK